MDKKYTHGHLELLGAAVYHLVSLPIFCFLDLYIIDVKPFQKKIKTLET